MSPLRNLSPTPKLSLFSLGSSWRPGKVQIGPLVFWRCVVDFLKPKQQTINKMQWRNVTKARKHGLISNHLLREAAVDSSQDMVG